jgi:hypothetical protein
VIDKNTTEDTGIAAYMDSSIPGPNDTYLFLVVNNECARFLLKDCANVVSGRFARILDRVSHEIKSAKYDSDFLKVIEKVSKFTATEMNDVTENNFYVKSVKGLWCPAFPSSYGFPTMIVDIRTKFTSRWDSNEARISWTIDLAASGRREQFSTEKRSLDRYEFSDKIHKFFEHEGGVCECEGKSAADLILG